MPQFITEEPVMVGPHTAPEQKSAAPMDLQDIDALEARIAAGDIRPGQLAEMVPALIATIRDLWPYAAAVTTFISCADRPALLHRVKTDRFALFLDSCSTERARLDALRKQDEVRAEIAALRSEHDRRVSEILEANNKEVERRRQAGRERDGMAVQRDGLALQIDVSRRIAAVRERLLKKVIGQRDELTARFKALEERARAVVDGAQGSYRARNGRECYIEADDGERCLIVHSDLMHELEAALSLPAQDAGTVPVLRWDAAAGRLVSEEPAADTANAANAASQDAGTPQRATTKAEWLERCAARLVALGVTPHIHGDARDFARDCWCEMWKWHGSDNEDQALDASIPEKDADNYADGYIYPPLKDSAQPESQP